MSDKWLEMKRKNLTARGRILPLVERVATKQNQEGQAKRDTNWLHPSEICKTDWCPRSSYYKFIDPAVEPPITFSLLNVFAEGNSIHDKWQRWLAESGVLIGKWVCNACRHETYGERPNHCECCAARHKEWVSYREVPIFDEEYGVIGHSDGHIKDAKGEALIEIKSVGVGTLRFEAPDLFAAINRQTMTLDNAWKSIRYPFITHIRQGQLYMHFTGIHTIVFIYECKWNQQVKEFTIHYDQAKIDHILKGCLAVQKARESNKPPLRPTWADEDHKTCQKCPYYERCWKRESGSPTE